MQFLSTILSATSLATIVSAQAPFPLMTKSYPLSIVSKFSSDQTAYLASVYTQPAWSSASMALESELPDLAAYSLVNGDPVSLAQAYLFASATPTWFSELPSDIQGFVSSVAAAEATIAAKDSGAASNANANVWVCGVVLAAGAAGMLLL